MLPNLRWDRRRGETQTQIYAQNVDISRCGWLGMHQNTAWNGDGVYRVSLLIFFTECNLFPLSAWQMDFFFFFLLHCHKPLGQKAIMYICTCMHVHLDSFSGSATGKSLWVRLNRSWLDCHQSRRSDAWSGFLLLSVTMDTCVMCLDIYRERYEASPHLLFESFVLEGFNVQRTEATSVVEYGREE